MSHRTKKRKQKTVDDCKRHFNARWYQRVMVKMDSQYDLLNSLIQGKISNSEKYIECVGKESLTRTHFRIYLNGIPYIVVYNRKLKSVVTIFLERELPSGRQTLDSSLGLV